MFKTIEMKLAFLVISIITFTEGMGYNMTLEMKAWYQIPVIDNYISGIFLLGDYFSSTKSRCAVRCTLSADCASFFYTKLSGSCRLHNRIFELELPLPVMTSVPGTSYFVDRCTYHQFKKLSKLSKYIRADFEHATSHEAAEAKCNSFGGRLLRLETDEDFNDTNIIMETLVKNQSTIPSDVYWLAAQRYAGQISFQWPDGSDILSSLWMPNEPDTVHFKNCVVLVLGSGTGNIECDYQKQDHRLFPLCECEL